MQVNCLCLLCTSRWLLENVDKFLQASILTLGSLPAVSCLLSIRRPLRSLSPSRSPSGGPHSSHTIQNPIGIEAHATRHPGWRERSGHSHTFQRVMMDTGHPFFLSFFFNPQSQEGGSQGDPMNTSPAWLTLLWVGWSCHHWGWATSERYKELSGAEGCSPPRRAPVYRKGLQK